MLVREKFVHWIYILENKKNAPVPIIAPKTPHKIIPLQYLRRTRRGSIARPFDMGRAGGPDCLCEEGAAIMYSCFTTCQKVTLFCEYRPVRPLFCSRNAHLEQVLEPFLNDQELHHA